MTLSSSVLLRFLVSWLYAEFSEKLVMLDPVIGASGDTSCVLHTHSPGYVALKGGSALI